MKFLPRILSNDPCCQVWSDDQAHGKNRMLETADLLLMGPNRAPQIDARILHGNGTLWRLPVDTPTVAAIPLQGVPLDNDHPHIARLRSPTLPADPAPKNEWKHNDPHPRDPRAGIAGAAACQL